jgi:hypothetical protein
MDVAKAGDLVAKVVQRQRRRAEADGHDAHPVTAAQDKLKESTKNATSSSQARRQGTGRQDRDAQKALARCRSRVGGQAEAYGKTSAGAQDRFRVAVENLRESDRREAAADPHKVTNKAAISSTRCRTAPALAAGSPRS